MSYLTLSYPRCGSSFIHYLIYTATKRQYTFHVSNRIHYFKKGGYNPNGNKPIILLLRNYKECVPRNNCKNFEKMNLQTEIKGYFWAIEQYEQYKGKKHLIYYRDLIKNTKDEILKLSKFLNIDFTTIIDNLDFYIEQSRKNYNKNDIYGTTSNFKIDHHRYKLSIEIRKKWDRLFKEYNPQLFDKYLKQYEYKEI